MDKKIEPDTKDANTLPIVSLLLYRKFAIASDNLNEANKKPPTTSTNTRR
jgi:hypothetical protein